MPKPVKIDLLSAPEGTRFTIPKWLDLPKIQYFSSGLDSDSGSEDEAVE